ncbi:hypothetical protein V496_06086 [Pseudogymnoascus sp. VKM F-4515 (FW-2607)]|nr:hypothetical protein V496_06086 [Pseudogymnoascus sp. VKM F-4515 (FW-2607)]
MNSTNRSILIAFIKCGTPSTIILQTRGEYGDIMGDMLDSVAATLPEPNMSPMISYLSFDAEKGQLPGWASVDGFDAVFITGSSYSAFNSQPWIWKLGSFIKAIYKDKPNIRLFGSCFGHQIICHSLFKELEKNSPLPTSPSLPGSLPLYPVVSRNPSGWELGVHPIKLSEAFMARFGKVSSNPDCQSTMRLRLIHQDHVNPLSLPKDFVNVGSSERCDIQGIYKRGRVLTLQGHPEFDNNIMVEFGKPLLGKGIMDEVKTGPDDYEYGARAILEFLFEEADVKATEEVIEGKVGAEGGIMQEDVMERLIVLFNKLTVCQHSGAQGTGN